eukprot:6781671-Pyramimonas_sp.AAC.1
MHIAENLDPLVYRLALAKMFNNLDRAKRCLMRSFSQLTAEAKAMQEASSNGLYTDETEREQVSLQTGEVFFDNTPPLLVPNGLVMTDEFQQVFDKLRPQCTVVEDSSNRVWYKIADNTEGRMS